MELLTVKQAAEMLNVSVGTVRNLLRRGELPSLRVGNQIRFIRENLERWINDRVQCRYEASGGRTRPDFRPVRQSSAGRG